MADRFETITVVPIFSKSSVSANGNNSSSLVGTTSFMLRSHKNLKEAEKTTRDCFEGRDKLHLQNRKLVRKDLYQRR